MERKSQFDRLSHHIEFLVWVGGILIAGAILVFIAWPFYIQEPRIAMAKESYRAGERATTVSARKEFFNKALEQFLQLERDYHPNFGNGRLYYDIGNTYFQLEEYPWAILYYQRAQGLMPRDEQVERNLTLAKNKLSLSKNPSRGWDNLLSLQEYISLPERLQLFFALCVLTFLLGSGWVWSHNTWFLSGLVVVGSLLCILLISLGWTRYFAPIDAVLVHAVELRRDAGKEFAKIGEQPVPAGTTVEVLEISSDGTWIKIAIPSGEFGYAPQESVKLVL